MTATKKHLEFLLEGESDQVVLEAILPKILPPGVTYDCHPFLSKQNLIKKLPERLRGYRSRLRSDWKIVILIDNDSQDCKELRKKYISLLNKKILLFLATKKIKMEL